MRREEAGESDLTTESTENTELKADDLTAKNTKLTERIDLVV